MIAGQSEYTCVLQMGIIGDKMDIDFVVNVGNNFYDNGLTGVDDDAFEESFTKIYTAESLQKPWYTSESMKVFPIYVHNRELHFIRTLYLLLNIGHYSPKRLNFSLQGKPISRISSLWTQHPSYLATGTNPKNNKYEWRGVAPREKYITKVLEDVDSALKQSTAAWKIVVGHHAIRSVSEHGDTQELIQQLLPIHKANEVDLYINGHDHCLEHISSRDSPLQYLTSGAGSKAWRGSFTPNYDKLEFFYDGQGFMSLQLSKEEVHLTFYDVAAAGAIPSRCPTETAVP
ncbi:hypothetical protein EJB05_27207, partial [Eragrostis curvula]